MRKYDVELIICGVYLALLVVGFSWRGPATNVDFEFGYEYAHVARALVEGRGFSDPFGIGSGPTAWTAPLLSYFLAGVFWLFGTGQTAVWVVMLAKFAGMALTALLLMRATVPTPLAPYRWLIPGLLGSFWLLNQFFLFDIHYDFWLTHLALAWLLWLMSRYHYAHRWPQQGYAAAFLMPLLSPALALVLGGGMLTIVAARVWAHPATLPRLLTTLALTGACGAASAALWGARNYAALGQFIPTKSNFWYEFYQANVLADGVVTPLTFRQHHPYFNPEAQREFLAAGELTFLEEYRAEGRRFLQQRPAEYVENVGRRAFFTFLYAGEQPSPPRLRVRLMPPPDVKALRAAGLMVADDWMGPIDQAATLRLVAPLGLEAPEALAEEVAVRHAGLQKYYNSWRYRLRHLLEAALPTGALLCGLLIGRVRREPLFRLSAGLYLLYLFLYVLVATFNRYLFMAVPLQVMLVFFPLGYAIRCLLYQRPLVRTSVESLFEKR